jgi:hypothetical protein
MLQDSLRIPNACTVCAFPRGAVNLNPHREGAEDLASESFEMDGPCDCELRTRVNQTPGTMLAYFIISSRDHEYLDPRTTNTKSNENARIHNTTWIP